MFPWALIKGGKENGKEVPKKGNKNTPNLHPQGRRGIVQTSNKGAKEKCPGVEVAKVV